jgi:serine/threonine protein kinase
MKLAESSEKVNFFIINIGGFGKVKVAKNKKTGKYVALKLLNKG